jgi:hypothetical protein
MRSKTIHAVLRPGDRIELVSMLNDPNPIAPGTKGTVTFVTDLGSWVQVGVNWDNGRGLMLTLPEDKLKVLTPCK